MRAPRAATPGGQPDDEQPVARRLSWTRLGLLSLVVVLVAGGSFVSVTDAVGRTNPETRSWSVPYVDVTLTPSFQFQDPSANPARTVALAFVVADPQDDCAPSWGGYYSLEQAGSDLELDRRIEQLRSAGGDVMVSLGGRPTRSSPSPAPSPTTSPRPTAMSSSGTTFPRSTWTSRGRPSPTS